MKKSEKKGLIILIVTTILIISVIYFITKGNKNKNVNANVEKENKVVEEFVQVLEDGTKLNTSTKLSEKKTVNGLTIGNIQLTMKDNQSVLLADVENTSGTKTSLTIVDIILLDKNENEIATITGLIGELKPGEKQQLNSSVTSDYANAYDFKVVVK